MKSGEKLFITTAVIEVGAGLVLVGVPALVIWLLLGVREPSAEALVVGRVAGVALLGLGIAAWVAHSEQGAGLGAGAAVGAAGLQPRSGSGVRGDGGDSAHGRCPAVACGGAARGAADLVWGESSRGGGASERSGLGRASATSAAYSTRP